MATSPPVTTAPDTTPAAPAVVPGRTKMIVVLGALVALGPLTIDMYLPALPRIADELGVSSSVAQLTLTGTLAGLAVGQLVVGPLSDSLGRRRPLMAGIVLHMVASLLCLLAPSLTMLAVARALQGMGAAAAMVVAVAVVGDLFNDSAAATVMSRLMLVLGVAPVLAPSLGAAVLLHASWHWVFAVLIVLAGALLVMAALALPETLPPSHRRPLRLRSILATYAGLLGDVRFVMLVLVGALGMSGLFAYISGASFVLQGRHGLNQQSFALVFGAGAIALIAATQFNVVLLRRFTPQRIMVVALVAATLAGAVFIALSVDPHRRRARLRPARVDRAGHARVRHPQRARGRAVPSSRSGRHRRRAARCRTVRRRRADRAGGRPTGQRRDRAVGGDDRRRGHRAAGPGGRRRARRPRLAPASG